LTERAQLRAIVLLLDIRHKPNANDLMMYGYITHYGHHMFAVATKADKVSRGKIPSHIKEIRNTLGLPHDVPIVPFSSETKQGRDELWQMIKERL
jgi:GTP-binding protein